MPVHGYCDERFAAVREAFEKNFSEYGDVGASFAATLEGDWVVDLWGGHRDLARTQAWEKDTIVNVFSTTKTMTFLCALILADRKQLDLQAPVARYWPEFSQNGKEDVSVMHCLTHSAGLPGFSRGFGVTELCDWDLCCSDLAAQAPWWEPGTQSGYHAITQGYLIGEILRRVTGQSIGAFFKHEVSEKVGADFQIGVDPADFPRVAELLLARDEPLAVEMDPDSIAARTFAGSDGMLAEIPGSSAWMQAEIPAANGHGNARSVVTAQTVMANEGKAFGVELLSESQCRRAHELQIEGMDAVLQFEVPFAVGYALPVPGFTVSANPNTIWWAGAGGSTITIDQDAHLCFSYVMNQMSNDLMGDPRSAALARALYAGLAA